MEHVREDVKFLISLLPDWTKEVPKDLCPTFYGTCSYNGDVEIKNKIDNLKKKYNLEN